MPDPETARLSREIRDATRYCRNWRQEGTKKEGQAIPVNNAYVIL